MRCKNRTSQNRAKQQGSKTSKSADDQPAAGHLFPEDKTIAARLRENLRAKYRE
jgi:hypothetical protein